MFKWLQAKEDDKYYRLDTDTGLLEREDEIEDNINMRNSTGYNAQEIASLVLTGTAACTITCLVTLGVVNFTSKPQFSAGVHLLNRVGKHREAIALQQIERTCAVQDLLPSCTQTMLHGIEPEIAQVLK